MSVIRLRSSWRPMLTWLRSARTTSQAFRRWFVQAGAVAKSAASAVTLMGVLFLVYHIVYANALTVSSQDSDPQNPFRFPFTIQNNGVLAARNLQWSCRLIHGEGPSYSASNVGFWIGGTAKKLRPDAILNISCKQAVQLSGEFRSIVLDIEILYDAEIIGPVLIPRRSDALFAWSGEARNPRWIRGGIAEQ